ncbi:MAG: response regulator, partial [Clostridiales bacterium]|nr:response regulator [Clostridiales bacterium]
MPNILIVDDERSITDLVELYLKNENFNVLKFYNGTDALNCLKETPLDLAILDIMLP